MEKGKPNLYSKRKIKQTDGYTICIRFQELIGAFHNVSTSIGSFSRSRTKTAIITIIIKILSIGRKP
jgi:hypothetical protein